MRRRGFLSLVGGGALAAAAAERSKGAAGLLRTLVLANDERLPALLERQERRPGHRWHGGFNDDFRIHVPGATAGAIKRMVAAWVSPDSRFHRSSDLASRVALASRALLRAQHQDGTIDLPTTNFGSPPDTAFVVEPVCSVLAALRDVQDGPLAEARADLMRFARAAGQALARGGIHTPNHRWVVCGALARLNAIEPDPLYVSRIDEWLGEGIDIDADGQYTERSTSVYSPACDRALLTVARLLSRRELLDPVRRNLEMTLYFVHPDGEVATEASRRQDQYRRGSLRSYHIPYRWLASVEGDGRFAAIARLIEEQSGGDLSDEVLDFLEDDVLRRELPAEAPLPDDYVRVFPHSDLVRIRHGAMSATVLARNPCLFSLRKGSAALEAVRLASAFFGKGQFQGDGIETRAAAYTMKQELAGPYYQPLLPKDRRADGAWVPGALRPQSEVHRLDTSVAVREDGGGFALDIRIAGTNDVPVAVELGFRRGGELTGVVPVQGISDAFLLEGEAGEYRSGSDRIRFGPGRSDHLWTQLRGALPKLDAQCVYLTGFTPFETTLRIW
jgi:hypothetical protein